jgi:molecular chaperone Hsp33
VSDQIIHATIAGENVRLLAGVTTGLVSEICRRHGTWPGPSAALGRTLTGTLLLGLMQKDLERVTVQFSCSGPIKGIVATADAHGNARGYVTNPHVDAPLRNEKLNVAGIVGSGMMYVTREAGFEIGLMKEPYRGSVEIVSGEIAQDFTYYLAKSEQIPSGVSLGVFVTGDLEVTAAGGFIVQLMPGADETLADELTARLANAPSSSDLVRSGATPLEMLETALGRTDFEVLETRSARFACTCSPERARQIVGSLGRDVLEEMVAKGTGEEVVCHVCSERYFLDVDTLRELLAGCEA